MNIIRTTIAAAMSLAALAANAQHATTLTIYGNDSATFTAINSGPTDIVSIELLAGSRLRDGAVFGPGTAGTQSYAHWGASDRYSITTLGMDLQTGESEVFVLNLDGVWLNDTIYSASVYTPFAYAGSRALVMWSDGFERLIPMSRGMDGGSFNFSDMPPIPAVPEPATAALMLAGCLLVGAVARKGGSK